MGNCCAFNNMEDIETKLLQTTCGHDFTFAGNRFLAKVVDCYDGDTIRVAFEYCNNIIQYKARMAGYDSPEMKPLKSNLNREAEKKAAIDAKTALLTKINNELVYIECGEFDKYGRILITVYTRDGENINSWMMTQGYGTPYNGEKKTQFVG